MDGGRVGSGRSSRPSDETAKPEVGEERQSSRSVTRRNGTALTNQAPSPEGSKNVAFKLEERHVQVGPCNVSSLPPLGFSFLAVSEATRGKRLQSALQVLQCQSAHWPMPPPAPRAKTTFGFAHCGLPSGLPASVATTSKNERAHSSALTSQSHVITRAATTLSTHEDTHDERAAQWRAGPDGGGAPRGRQDVVC